MTSTWPIQGSVLNLHLNYQQHLTQLKILKSFLRFLDPFSHPPLHIPPSQLPYHTYLWHPSQSPAGPSSSIWHGTAKPQSCAFAPFLVHGLKISLLMTPQLLSQPKCLPWTPDSHIQQSAKHLLNYSCWKPNAWILTTSNPKPVPFISFLISINDTSILSVAQFKILGVICDFFLLLKFHIQLMRKFSWVFLLNISISKIPLMIVHHFHSGQNHYDLSHGLLTIYLHPSTSTPSQS